MKEDCTFCQIVSGQLPANIVYEDDDVIAFLDIDPVTEGHTLVVPKHHFEDIIDIDNPYLEKVSKACKLIAERIYSVLKPEGFNILQNNRKTPGNHVMHFHMNIIPRAENDGIKMFYAEIPPQTDLFSKLPETLGKIKF